MLECMVLKVFIHRPHSFVTTLVRHPYIVENREGKLKNLMLFFLVQFINNMQEDLFSEFNNQFFNSIIIICVQ